ncbi:uncharacterized protein LOC122375065 [Amphibalanus amphitrite]|uniref:uncharacterized protein LOC122375065 n=1 Tax=Amphibalanus amphitrite TaxID=1232801 RepID=UPI001C912955|nr:uncharacterized protein LOC122375065 [Amphibalanus amphitrite]
MAGASLPETGPEPRRSGPPPALQGTCVHSRSPTVDNSGRWTVVDSAVETVPEGVSRVPRVPAGVSDSEWRGVTGGVFGVSQGVSRVPPSDRWRPIIPPGTRDLAVTSREVASNGPELVSAETSHKNTSKSTQTSEEVHDPDSDMSDVDDIDAPEEDVEILDSTPITSATMARIQKSLIYASSHGDQGTPSDVISSLNDVISSGHSKSSIVPGPTPFPVYDRRFTGSRALFPQRRRRPTRLRLWPNGVIPYSISSNYSSSERELINRVFRLFETVTCLRLVPRTSEKDYVRITPTGRCSGEVGRRGGRQKISLPHWCLSFGHAAHELMHTAGFWHEHQRPDRDQFVRVLWDNIKPRHRRADYGRRVWEELGEGSWLGPYDFRSILHYSGRGSAVDSTKPTMVARQGGVKLGGNGNLTDIDIWKINTQYHCWQRRVANSLYEFGDNRLGGREGRRFGRLVTKEESTRNSPKASSEQGENNTKKILQTQGTATFTSKTKSTEEVLGAIKELVEYRNRKTPTAKEQILADNSASNVKGGEASIIPSSIARHVKPGPSKVEVIASILQGKSIHSSNYHVPDTSENRNIEDAGKNGEASVRPEDQHFTSDLEGAQHTSQSDDRETTGSAAPSTRPSHRQRYEFRAQGSSSRTESSHLDLHSVAKHVSVLGNEEATDSSQLKVSRGHPNPHQVTSVPESQIAATPPPTPLTRLRVVVKLKDLLKPTATSPTSTTPPTRTEATASPSGRQRDFDRVVISLTDLQKLRASRQQDRGRILQQHQQQPTEPQAQQNQRTVVSYQLPQLPQRENNEARASPGNFQRAQRKLPDNIQYNQPASSSSSSSINKNNPFGHIGGFRIGDRWFFSRSPTSQQTDDVTTEQSVGRDDNPFRHIGGFKVGNEWHFVRNHRRTKRSWLQRRQKL